MTDLCGDCCHPWAEHGLIGCLVEVSDRYTCDCPQPPPDGAWYFLGRRHGMEAVLARLERKLERAA